MVSSAKLSWFGQRKVECSRALPPASSSSDPPSFPPLVQPTITQNKIKECACVSEKVEWEAIDQARTKLITKLECEREKLAADLGSARAQQSAAQAAAEESRARSVDLEAHVAQLCAALEVEMRGCRAKAAQIRRLETSLDDARDAGARREEERARFHYVLAPNGQTGSISRTVLASAPDSLLYKMYCGDWEYPRDENGRAIITCHPDRWASVLEHLTTGTVPTEPDSRLLDQARYWYLGRLVRGLEALYPGVVVLNDPDAEPI
ncbi:hypothetical protein KFL_001630210 [Klebsormidium nitens]|uniref:Uncharacterized protein n=1 Tax=Klebsormidium nitens TaxID=105231 RepID=A0A1Y1HYU6_KLENI|nr:hypothetical protein KFL_001630210 [Klebsormidium nitens]|eukprot:GAQ83824.1 hypothetical protein KFL_001630210 [Klebsormidium nitens]